MWWPGFRGCWKSKEKAISDKAKVLTQFKFFPSGTSVGWSHERKSRRPSMVVTKMSSRMQQMEVISV